VVVSELKSKIRQLQLDLYHKDLSLEETKQKLRHQLAEEVKIEFDALLMEKNDELERTKQHLSSMEARMRRVQGNNEDSNKVEELQSIIERLQEENASVSKEMSKLTESFQKTFDENKVLSTQLQEYNDTGKKSTKKTKASVEIANIKADMEKQQDEFLEILSQKESEIEFLTEEISSVKDDCVKKGETLQDIQSKYDDLHKEMNDIRKYLHQYQEQEKDNEVLVEKIKEDLEKEIESLKNKNSVLTTRLLEREKKNSHYVKHLEQKVRQLEEQGP
jgi:chromosome segregation ATPase